MNIFKKFRFKKFLVILLAVVVVFNFIGPNYIIPKSYAAIDVAGILLYPLSFLVSFLADAVQVILDTAFYITSTSTLPGTNAKHIFVTNIVRNQVPQFQVNIFDSTMDKSALIGTMQSSIYKWYGITRMVAIAASLAILVYVAIRILTSTAVGDKAKYKTLLRDWLMSLVLIFTMNYIMAAILFGSDAMTNAFADIRYYFRYNKYI